MSLLNLRRERRSMGNARAKKPSLFRLIFILLLVLGAIWWLGRIG